MEAIDTVVLITGAAGGLGRALVAEFGRRGQRVVAASHRAPRNGQADRAFPIQLDVTDPTGPDAAIKLALERWGRVDVLINNAGITADRRSWQISEADWDDVMAVNLKGAFLCSRAALPPMLAQREGHIINVASFAARHGSAGQANYAAAKAGLIGLTQSLAKEVGAHDVRVNAVLPGVMRTAMTARLTERQLADFAAANALGRLNDAGEVARFIAFLATTRNISGQVFQLDSRIARWT